MKVVLTFQTQFCDSYPNLSISEFQQQNAQLKTTLLIVLGPYFNIFNSFFISIGRVIEDGAAAHRPCQEKDVIKAMGQLIIDMEGANKENIDDNIFVPETQMD